MFDDRKQSVRGNNNVDYDGDWWGTWSPILRKINFVYISITYLFIGIPILIVSSQFPIFCPTPHHHQTFRLSTREKIINIIIINLETNCMLTSTPSSKIDPASFKITHHYNLTPRDTF